MTITWPGLSGLSLFACISLILIDKNHPFFSSQMDSLLKIIQTCHIISYRLNRHIFILDFKRVLTLAHILISPFCIEKVSMLFKSSTYVLENVLQCTWDLLSSLSENSRVSEVFSIELDRGSWNWCPWNWCRCWKSVIFEWKNMFIQISIIF